MPSTRTEPDVREAAATENTCSTDEAATREPSVEARFAQLAEQWRRETGMLSSVSKIIRHPCYQEIISLGEPALPLILRDLRDRHGFWFFALKAIAKNSPVPPEHRPDPKLAREAWLTWGRKNGLIE